jgi:arylsulfatase
MSRRRLSTVILLLVIAAAAAVWLVQSRRAAGPAIILISIDTLRADHLGCYGYGLDTSPNLDTLAREAVVFENCFSQAPTTRPSCASFLTGFLPHECRIFGNSDNIPLGVPTVAQSLRAAGYGTAAVSSNFVLGRDTGFDRGFDEFDHNLDAVEAVRKVPERIAGRTTDAALAALEDRRKGKFFLWVHYQDPHGPYTPPAPFDDMFAAAYGDRASLRLALNADVSGKGGIPSYQQLGGRDGFGFYASRYDGEIAYLDKHLGRLIAGLKQLDLYDRSLIIVTADHGEGMGERNYFFAHGEYVYNTLIRVPLIVKPPDSAPRRRADYVQLLDLAPTILAAAGLEPPGALRGRDLLAEGLPPQPVFSEMPGKYSVIESGLKLVFHEDEARYMLFDLRSDPLEERDLAAVPEYSGYVAPLAADLADFRAQDAFGSGVVRTPANLSEEDKEKLKSLGYVH